MTNIKQKLIQSSKTIHSICDTKYKYIKINKKTSF